MTTLAKKRRRRFRPWESSLMTPWSNNFLRPDFGNFNRLLDFDSIFKDDFFEDGLMPAMNVKEHKDNFEIELAAPGFNKKDFEVSIEDNVLHVCGEKEEEVKKEEEDYSRQEFSYKSFKRSSSLPDSVDLDQDVKATYKNGILKVKLIKTKEAITEESPKKVIEVE